eukprot:EG_transcript_24513
MSSRVARIDSLRDEYRDGFTIFDRNSDGTLTKAELGIVMRTLGHTPSEAELAALIKEADLDRSGGVDFDEFVYLLGRRVAGGGEDDDVRHAFAAFDTDRSGRIHAHNLFQALASLGEEVTLEECQEMIRAADPARQGYVTLATFKDMLKAKP